MSADLKRLEGVIAPEVFTALLIADEELTRAGIPHLAIGGLAVCAHGYRRTTDDVDFLVGDEAFNHHGLVVSMKVPISAVGRVRVDQVSFADEPELQQELRRIYEPGVTGQIAPLYMLVFLKLKANRQKDIADVVELIKRGAVDDDELDQIDFDLAGRPELLKRWRCAVTRARKEAP